MWGDDTMSQMQVRVWSKRFNSGDEDTGHKKKLGRPRTMTTPENVQKVSDLLNENGKLSLHDICDRTGLKMTVVVRIVKKELNLSQKVAKLVPTELTAAQHQTRKTMSQENINRVCREDKDNDPELFVQSVITGDETWISTKEPESRFISTVWLPPKSARPKKAKTIPGSKKMMLTLFCDAQGVVLIDFLQPKETVNSIRYCTTLSRLKEAVRRKRPHLWAGRKFWINHDNASPHTSFDTTKKLDEWNLKVLPHAPNSPDLAPCDFSFFPRLKKELRGRRFDTIAELQKETQRILMSWPKEFFNDTMHELVGRWQKCVKADGEYFEGENVQIDALFMKGQSSSESESNSDSDA